MFAARKKAVKWLVANSVIRSRVDATWISGFVINKIMTTQNRRLSLRGSGSIFPSRHLGLKRGAINVGLSGRFLGRFIGLARQYRNERRSRQLEASDVLGKGV